MDFESAARRLEFELVRGEPLARHTTFRIGGPADWYATGTTVERLELLADLAAEHGVPLTVLGGGSNLLVSDRGIRGLVVANQARWHGRAEGYRDQWPEGMLPDCDVIAESGVPLAGFARWCIRNGLGGLEWAVSVPGTVAGAVIGNAGAHGSDTAANLAWVLVRGPGGARRVLFRDDLRYSYRSSVLKEQLLEAVHGAGPIVLAAGFLLKQEDSGPLAERADGYLARRRATQPVEPSAGSIFRNPTGDYAGRLIESLGLKGRRIGGAQVSPRHANFIVNAGEASAADVTALINLIRGKVFEATGIRLMPEILFVGEWTAPPLLAL